MGRIARVVLLVAIVAPLVAGASGCGDVNAALKRLSDAQALSADLQIEFAKAADASNRAVMADTDALSATFAKEADEAGQAVKADAAALAPMLEQLGYAEEPRLLRDFTADFARYDTLDRAVLDLAVENTNLKAQRLSFGEAQEAADAFQSALDVVTARASGGSEWHIKALAASAMSAVREIQALQAPHIAESADAEMTRIEARMTALHGAARRALADLAPLAGSSAVSQLRAATAALDHFMDVNGRILTLSRRNTNVRSLAMSLDEKRALAVTCDERARALRAALAKHGYPAGR